MSLVFLSFLGLAVGLLSALLGIGGGFLLVPLLVFLGYDPINAVGVSSFVVLLSSASSSAYHWRQGSIHMSRVLSIGLAAIALALVGVQVATMLSSHQLMFSMGCLALFCMVLVLAKSAFGGAEDDEQQNERHLALYIALGCVSGFFSGLFGIGGGAVLVPLLVLVIGMNVRHAVKLSLAVLVMPALSSCAAHAINGHILYADALLIAFFAICGSLVGSRLLPHVPEVHTQRAFVALLLFLALFSFAEASAKSGGEQRVMRQHTHWMQGNDGVLKGVVLMGHGLNLNPSKMETLGKTLSSKGFAVLNLVFTGHDGDVEAFSTVTGKQWEADFLRAYKEAKSRADAEHVPLYFVGHSMAAVVYAHAMTKGQTLTEGQAQAGGHHLAFDGAMLFAPALALRWYTSLGRVGLCADGHVRVPSRAPESYRQYPFTTIAAYRSFLGLGDDLAGRSLEALNIPTLVFADRWDKLISLRGLYDFKKKHGLSKWQVVQVVAAPEISSTYHHLFIDEATAGKRTFQQITDEMDRFLNRAISHSK